MKKKLLGVIMMSMVIACVPNVHASELTIKEMAVSSSKQTDDHSEFEIPVDQGQQGIDNNGQAATTNDQNTPIGDQNVLPDAQDTTGNNTGASNADQVILTLGKATALVGGEEVHLTSPPKVIDSVTLLPLRFIGDQVTGAATNWDSATKTITILKGDTTVIVTIGSKTAIVNGAEVEMSVAPQIINNRTLLPLRFIGESFGIKIDYNASDKTITIIKSAADGQQAANQAPIASFYFPDTYIAGQTVSAVNTSSDPDGDAIIDQLWSVEGATRVTNKELSKMFKTPRAGTYTIGLQVKDSKGLWSEWTYQVITINPNEAPRITSFMSSKTSYAQGEPLDFTYTYDNETWETVTEGKWTYRSVTQDPARATVGKPEALFTEGEYIITLYLDDAYGNRSQGIETRVTITSQKLMSELQYRFTKGKLGDWIDNFDNINYLSFAQANIDNITYDLGTLIMSDSPEMVTGQGILYRDSITGSGRLLIHHINNIASAAESQKLAVIIENPTDKPVMVTLNNKVIKGPSTDILRVGQLALKEYLQGTSAEQITLAPGERKFIYNQTWTYGACISGHVDVETTGKTIFMIADINASTKTDQLDSLTYFSADGAHYSGTYDKVGIHYDVVLDGTQAQRIILGVANAGEWAVGYDERTLNTVQNTGNYGITYYVTVTAGEDMGVILNNRGGIFQGAIKWQGEGVYNMPGNGSFNGTTTKAVVMGILKKGETKTFEYLLPNGSATPTLIGFIPASQW